MFHVYRWMKYYPITSPKAITECCDLDTDVPWASMNEVLSWGPAQPNGRYWMLWLGHRCAIGNDEWSATQGLALWPLLNVVTRRQMFHGHRWMKCYPGTSPMAITECCDLETDVPWASMNEVLPRDQNYVPWALMNEVLPTDQHYVPWALMNEVLPRDQPYGHYWMLWLGDRCSMGIDEWSATQGPALWPLLNVVTGRRLFHGYQ
jgi:hypothetical protein